MRKRIACLVLCFLLAAPAALASTDEPSRSVWCRGLARLKSAVQEGRRIEWTVSLEPDSLGGLSAGELALAREMTLEGAAFAAGEGGGIEASLLFGGEEILAAQAARGDGWSALTVGGQTVLTETENAAQTAEEMGLGALGALLLSFDSAFLTQTPYFSPALEAGTALWRLASPYAADTNRLSVGSGATSHAVTYEIGTDGVRAILDGFVQAFEGKTLFLPGISAEEQAAFVEKARAMARSAEAVKPLKASMTFGEGDLMRTARLSGSIRMDGKTAGVSYTYSCSVTSTRLTRKYALSYQPPVGDTISLNATYLTSSSGKGGAQRQVSVRMSGKYDGESYSVSFDEKTVNKYSLDEERNLHERLQGEVSVQVKYGGEKTVVLSATHESELISNRTGLARMDGAMRGKLTLRGATVFEGGARFTLASGELGDEPLVPLDAQNDAAALRGVWEDAVRKLISLLPDELVYRISISE